MKKLNYIDLFAGAGGLSEGFVRAGFNPIIYTPIKNKTALLQLEKPQEYSLFLMIIFLKAVERQHLSKLGMRFHL